MRHVTAIAIGTGAIVVACGLPRSPDSIEARCAIGFDRLEASECSGDVHGKNPEYLKYVLETYKRECGDRESVARIEKIRATCLTAQKAAVRDIEDDRRKVRATYVSEVSALLLDPAYAPMVDRYREAKERAFHGDALAKREADEALGELAVLAQRHGIDPRFGRELDLW